MKRIQRAVGTLMLVALPACGVVQASAPGPIPDYPPLTNVAGRLTPSKVSLGPWHTLANLTPNDQLVGLSQNHLVMSIFPSPANGWRQTLYLVNARTGKSQTVLHLPFEHEATSVALSPDWLVYADALATNASYRTVMAKQLHSNKTYTLLSLTPSISSVGPVKGLSIVGNTAYWLSTLATPEGLISRVYRDNLTTRQLSVVASANQKTQNQLFVALRPAPRGLFIAVTRATNPRKPSSAGALWFKPYHRTIITECIPLFQAPSRLEGVSAGTVLFSTRYRPETSSTLNGGSFPVYALNVLHRTTQQLTSAVNPGGAVSVDGTWAAIDGLSDHSELVNWQNRTELSLPYPNVMIGHGWVVMRAGSTLQWQVWPSRRSSSKPL